MIKIDIIYVITSVIRDVFESNLVQIYFTNNHILSGPSIKITVMEGCL